LAYPIGVLAALHFYLRVKADHTQPILYASILGVGFALRLAARVKKSRDMRLRVSLRSARSAPS
jgi:DMSO/TMAO reductase YedYZ heme-binding membrane subunit